MAKFVNKITDKSCKRFHQVEVDDISKEDNITIEKLSKRCKKAADIYGKPLFKWLGTEISRFL